MRQSKRKITVWIVTRTDRRSPLGLRRLWVFEHLQNAERFVTYHNFTCPKSRYKTHSGVVTLP